MREFTPKDIEEIFDLRVMMESYAIDKIAEHLTEEMASQLYGCLEELKSAWNLRNLPAYIEADTQLHDLIIAFSGNSFLVIAYERVHIMIQQFRSFSLLGQKRFDESMEEHQSIVDNIVQRRLEEAKRINSQHLRLAMEQIKKYLSEKAQ